MKGSSTEQIVAEVMAAESRRHDAVMQGDVAAYGALLADDFMLVHSHGTACDRQGLLDFVDGEIEYVAISRDDVKVRVYGEDIAVMTGNMINTVRGKLKGDIVVVPLRVLQVWHREGAAWKMVSMQCTRMPETSR